MKTKGSRMYKKKIAKHNKKLRWLLKHRNHIGDACLIFPFAPQSTGYMQFKYKGRERLAHRAMCYWKHGKAPTKQHVAAHICGNGHLGCVNPNHVFWKTQAENMLDRLKHGTLGNKLTEKQVIKIRWCLSKTRLTYKQIGAKFGVSAVMVHNIFHGKAWSCLR